ncbi:MAG: sensor histidine kinase, partial [Desulfobacteraceae bacterium]
MSTHVAGRIGPVRESYGEVPWRMYLIIVCAGLILTGIVGYGFYTADRMNKIDAPSMDAVSLAKLETTRAHHRIETIASGESFDNIESALIHLDQALYYMQAILAGREGAGQRLYPIEDPGLQEKIRSAKEILSELKAVTWQRLASREIRGTEKEIDSLYFDRLNGFMDQIDRVRTRLEEIKAENFGRFRATQWILVFICILLTLAVGVAFHRFERRGASDFAALTSVRDRLEKEVSERKAVELALRESEARLEELLKEIRNFAAIVSHDLRAPLVNLKGFVREIALALEKIKPEMQAILSFMPEDRRRGIVSALEEDLPEALGFISASASRMETMIQAVLRLSRIEDRRLNPESIDMNALLSGLLESFAYRIKQQGIRISTGSLPETRADRFAMEQVFSNLIGNAIAYLAPDRPGEISIGAERHPDEIVFHVRDNGLGIQSSDLVRIFDIFQRASKDVPGEGMGLTYT